MWLWLVALGCPKTAGVEAPVADAHLQRAWQSPLRRDHPDVGLVWSVRADAPSTWDALLADARGAAVVYLGEKHDNLDHHTLQAEVIAAVAPKAVVFEQLDAEDGVGGVMSPEAVKTASAWDDSGWPPFDGYAPVFRATEAAGAAVVAGHPTRAQVKTAMTDGFAALGDAVTGLPLDPGLPEPLRQALATEIVDTHCGMANDALVEKMQRAQLLKDTWMARAVAAQPRPTVLVAGNGHTRADRGVPFWVAVPDGAREVVVAFLEVYGDTRATDVDPEGADWLVFTPRHDEDDPCAGFRK